MRLAVIGTGRIVKEALDAMRPVAAIECTAIFGRPHSWTRRKPLLPALLFLRSIRIMMRFWQHRILILCILGW